MMQYDGPKNQITLGRIMIKHAGTSLSLTYTKRKVFSRPAGPSFDMKVVLRVLYLFKKGPTHSSLFCYDNEQKALGGF